MPWHWNQAQPRPALFGQDSILRSVSIGVRQTLQNIVNIYRAQIKLFPRPWAKTRSQAFFRTQMAAVLISRGEIKLPSLFQYYSLSFLPISFRHSDEGWSADHSSRLAPTVCAKLSPVNLYREHNFPFCCKVCLCDVHLQHLVKATRILTYIQPTNPHFFAINMFPHLLLGNLGWDSQREDLGIGYL